MIINVTGRKHKVYNLDSFIESRQQTFADDTLREFEEFEILEQTKVHNNIAQRHSEYQKTGIFKGEWFIQNGHKFLQFINTNEGWKINCVIWEDETE